MSRCSTARLEARRLPSACATASNPITTATAMMRTSLLHSIGGFDEALPHTADMEMWLRFAAHSFNEAAILRFEHLRSLRLNVGSMDLRIAAVAPDRTVRHVDVHADRKILMIAPRPVTAVAIAPAWVGGRPAEPAPSRALRQPARRTAVIVRSPDRPWRGQSRLHLA